MLLQSCHLIKYTNAKVLLFWKPKLSAISKWISNLLKLNIFFFDVEDHEKHILSVFLSLYRKRHWSYLSYTS